MGLFRGLFNLRRDVRGVDFISPEEMCALFEMASGVHETSRGRPYDDVIEKLAPSYWYSSALDTTPQGKHGEEVRRWVADPDDANLVGSVVTSTMNHRDDSPEPEGGLLDGFECHQILLDIDHPAALIPSTSPDHAHLYVKLPRNVPWNKYLAFLEACADVGLVSRSYVEHSRKRKMTMVRPPWIKKPENYHGGFAGGYDDDETLATP